MLPSTPTSSNQSSSSGMTSAGSAGSLNSPTKSAFGFQYPLKSADRTKLKNRCGLLEEWEHDIDQFAECLKQERKKCIEFDVNTSSLPEDEKISTLDRLSSLNLGIDYVFMELCKNPCDAEVHHTLLRKQVSPDSAVGLPFNPLFNQAYASAFKSAYETNSSVKLFSKQVLEYAKAYDSNFYLAPYFVLCQASGTGKTRLLKEISTVSTVTSLKGKGKLAKGAETSIFVVYLSLADPSSIAVPSRSPNIAQCLLRIAEPKEMRRRFRRFLLVLFQHLSKLTPEESKSLSQVLFDTSSKECFEFWLQLVKKMESIQKVEETELDNAFQELCETTSMSNTVMLLAIDEARGFIEVDGSEDKELFEAFRAVLRRLKTNQKFMSVLTTNFQPLSKLVVTASRKRSVDLFPPFFLMDTMDIFSRLLWRRELQYDQFFEVVNFFRVGRPCWSAFIDAHRGEDKSILFQEMQKHAELRLLSERIKLDTSKWKTTAILALLHSRVNLYVSPVSRLAVELVAQHMQICVNIDVVKQSVTVIPASDPIILNSAAQLLQEYGWSKSLYILKDAIRAGAVSEGHRGELIARIVFVYIWDLTCLQIPKVIGGYSQLCSLGAFMMNLFGEVAVDEIRLQIKESREAVLKIIAKNPSSSKENSKNTRPLLLECDLLESKMILLGFSSVSYVVKREHLPEVMKRGVGIICKRNQAGIDLMWPLLLPTNDFAMNSENMSYVLISVKNTSAQEAGKEFSSSYGMSSAYAGIEDFSLNFYISIYLQVGTNVPILEVPNKLNPTLTTEESEILNKTIWENKRAKIQKWCAQTLSKIDNTSKEERTRLLNSVQNVKMAYADLSQASIVTCTLDHIKGLDTEVAAALQDLRTAWIDPVCYVQNYSEKDIVKRMCGVLYA